MLDWLAYKIRRRQRKWTPGDDKIKIIHASVLKTWTRFPEYRGHDGPTLAEYEARRQAAEDRLWKVRHLRRMQDRLAEVDVDTPIEYARHEISVPSSIRRGVSEVALPKPDNAESTITCDEGEVFGEMLRVPRSLRKRTVTARYVCPSNVLNANAIAKLKEILSKADDKSRAQLAEARASRYLHPILFISHRWEAKDHPDPEGRQLTKLQTLEDCFVIYDYASFPQDTAAPEDEAALREILLGMNGLIRKVLVLTAPDFLERGWCIYEYIVASMRASLVCDELNDPNFVMLRNLAATNPPVSMRLLGHSVESEIQNAKNQKTLEMVNSILPLFNRSRFTVERDRHIVRDLLVSELERALPAKMEYVQYVGEWKTIRWTKKELQNAFQKELTWESLQYNPIFKPFKPKVPSSIAAAVKNGYRLDRMGMQNAMTWASLIDWSAFAPLVKALLKGLLIVAQILAAVVVVILVIVIVLLVWWIFF